MQANRRVILYLRYLFGHDTEYNPNIPMRQAQPRAGKITTSVGCLACYVYGGEIGAVRGATLGLFPPPPDAKQMVL
jgi:hypothetical protein